MTVIDLDEKEKAVSSYRSFTMVKSTMSGMFIAVTLIVVLVVLILALAFVPWQQSVSASGRVIIFSPMHRPQNIEAQIPARLHAWHVRDGETVEAGQLVAELSDLDPKFLDVNQAGRIKSQIKALQSRKEAAQSRYKAMGEQLESLRRSQGAAVPSAQERASQAKDRIWAAEQARDAAKQNLVTAKLNLERMKALHDKGLRSRRDLELGVLDETRAATEYERAAAQLQIAKRDQTLAIYDQAKILADTDAGLSNIMAAMASVKETIESTNSDILKLEVDLQNVQHRHAQRRVLAPCKGRIVKLMTVGAGETVDSGAVLAVIAPDTEDLAAELVVSDNDAPLVSVGRPVRLQFAGWPALQFAGWPSIAVGTFGGKVAVIDASDDGKCQFRVIVRPDEEAIAAGRDEPWPSTRFLRPGAEASGWIMLDTVPLGFELWRQFNAFPPTVKPEELGLHKQESGKSEVKRKSK